ncbi:hypothetical protein GOP47_0004071 [Adiantum capillus-veneris]|uniref:BZIP domain-containing protein n=1 Tax=Adiantum capillus-veneris TaxID=13818 RepID=A0A9D4ZM90_ADICA|nr:hypothetical protein GOP47_0004071 [Adiantum capillus-veneris]
MKSATGSTSGPPRTPLSSFASLTRQPSIYTLTLEELQNAVNEPGKNFGSMNMEEFIKNIWTVEESQAMAAAMSGVVEGNGSSSTGSASLPPASLQRGLSMPRNLTGKTVDEVWKEIHRSSDRNGPRNLAHRQVTMAEVTLEDFLAKAGFTQEEGEVEPSGNSSSSVVTMNNGVVSNAPADGMQASQAAPHQVDWLNFQLKGNMPHQQLLHHQHLLQQHQQQQQQQAEAAAAAFAGRLAAPTAAVISPVTALNVVDVSFDSTGNVGSANVLDVSFDSNAGAGLSLSSALVGSDRKRPHDACEEKSIEQRQKRMIKNRESAARSRARKQAYNVELESEVELLKEENAKLLQQQDERTRRRRKLLMETLIPVTSHPQTQKRFLRRTNSTVW